MHKKLCGERGIKTKGDAEDEVRFLEAKYECNKLTNPKDKKLFRICTLPLFATNRRPVGFNFKDSDEKTT